MFKRILKISGIVLLAFTIGVGLIVAYLAITGEFKKKVVHPTSVGFSIEGSEAEVLDEETGELSYPLICDVNATDEESVFSFNLTAEPADVTVRDCTITLNPAGARLITFKHKVNGEWEDYKSNSFKLNQKVYFVFNEINEENERDYIDGVIEITVTDKSGILQSKMLLSVDRQVSSISIKDLSNDNNNIVMGGKFKYELSAANKDVLNLGVLVGQDYPLQVISAPLKALDSIKAKGVKTSEIYYMDNNQPKLLIHSGEGVVNLRYKSDLGEDIEEPCNFIKYDTTKGVFVLNSSESAEFNFRVSTYKTYKQEEELKGKEYSDRVAYMVSKNICISVTGNDASGVKFGYEDSMPLNLFETSRFVVNNNKYVEQNLDVDNNLGLVLYKNQPYTEITDRYSEVAFIDSEYLINGAEWNFNYYVDNENDYKTAELKFETANNQPKVRLLRSLQNKDKVIKADTLFNAKLVKDGNACVLTLTNNEYAIEFTNLKFEGHHNKGFVKFDNTIMSIKRNLVDQALNLQEDNTIKAYKLKTSAFTSLNKSADTMWLPNVYYNKDYSLITSQTVFESLNYGDKLYKLNQNAMKFAVGDGLPVKKYVANIYYTKDVNGNFALLSSPSDFNVNTIYYVLTPSVLEETNSYLDNYNYIITNIGDEQNINNVYELWITDNNKFSTSFTFGDRLVVTSVDDQNKCGYQMIDKGIYLILLSSEGENLNNDFKIEYEYNSTTPNNSIIAITPINPTLKDKAVSLYALIINSDGSYYFTDGLQQAIKVSVLKSTPYVAIPTQNQDLELEISVPSGNYNLNYSSVNVENLVKVVNINSVELDEYGVVLVAPQIQYNAVEFNVCPDDWAEIYKNYYILTYNTVDSDVEFVENKYFYQDEADGEYKIATASDWTNKTCYQIGYEQASEGFVAGRYYTKSGNNYEFIKNLSYWYNGIEYKILGKIDVNGKFVNQIIPTGVNTNSHLYPIIPSVKYLPEEFRVQTVNEYIEMLFAGHSKTLQIENVIDLNNSSKFITTNMYYSFASEAVSVEFGGDYFNEHYSSINKTLSGDKSVIVQHEDCNVTIPNTDHIAKISDLTASVQFKLNTKADNYQQIFAGIKNDLKIKVSLYNSNKLINEYILPNDKSPIQTESIEIEYVYIPVTGGYDDNQTYYDKDNNVIEVEYNPDTWETDRENYYTRKVSDKLKVKFTAINEIGEDEYVYITFNYRENNFTSSKLYIASKDVTNYSIKPLETQYIAKVTSDTTVVSGKIYATLSENKFTQVNSLSSGNTYYEIEKLSESYAGEIRYLITVSYDGGYKYIVNLVDDKGSYLVDEKEGQYTASSTDSVGNAFTVGKNIDFAPFYASNAMSYLIDSNEYINATNSDPDLTYPDTFTINKITDNQFVNITLRNSIKTDVALTIKVKIVTSAGFEFSDINTKNTADTSDDIDNNYNYSSDTTTCHLDYFKFKFNSTDDLTATLTPALLGDDWEFDGDNSDIANKIWKYKNKHNSKDITIKYASNKWQVMRSDYSQYNLKIKFTGIIGVQEVTVNFTQPYSFTRSDTNTTNNVYAGTNFVLAKTKDKDGDALYTLSNNLSLYHVTYENGSTSKGEQLVANGGYCIWIETNINEYNFGIYYEEQLVETFTLNVINNGFILGDTSNVKTLDDENNTNDTINIQAYKFREDFSKYFSYNRYQETDTFVDGVYKKVNGEYILAADASDKGDDNKWYVDCWVELTPTYTYKAYTDEDYSQPYNVDIADFVGKTISINKPISELGTYYIKVFINNGIDTIGELKYKVEAKTNITVQDFEFETKENAQFDALTLADKTNINNNYYKEVEGAKPNFDVNKYYYVENGVYKLFTENDIYDDYQGKIYQLDTSLGVRDVFWINSPSKDLTITYTYGTTNYTQGWIADANDASKLIPIINYNSSNYKLLGTSYNWNGLRYDAIAGKLYNGNNEITTGITNYSNMIVYNDGTETHIYGVSNTYIFTDGTNYVILTLDNTYGKMLYTFNGTTLTDTGIKSANLIKIQFNYASFGGGLEQDAEFINQISATAEIIVIDSSSGKYYNIKSSQPLSINIKPYTCNVNEDDKTITVGDEGKTIELHTQGANAGDDTGMFKRDENITSIAISSTDVNVIHQDNKYSITLKPKYNVQYISLIITLTYSDGSTYSYTETFTIVNVNKVVVNYPYNTVDPDFNQDIEVLARSTDKSNYDTTDLKLWLNNVIDESQLDENPVTTMKFDLAIKGDTINLANDSKLNLQRFNVFTLRKSGDSYIADKYYKYNSATNSYELSTSVAQPEDWTSVKYYTLNTTTAVGKIELEAVSVSLENYLNDTSWLMINGSEISISNSFEGGGYLLFKVYENAKDTSPYGYYLLRVVNDSNFANVINARAEATIELNKTNHNEQPIIDLINNSQTQIATLGKINPSLVTSGKIYLFMVNNYDSSGNALNFGNDADPKHINRGQEIKHVQTLPFGVNTGFVRVAVVIKYGSSLVWLGNYRFVLDSTVTVTPNGVTAESTDEKVYKVNDNLTYDFATSSNNTKNLSDYLTLNAGSLDSVEFDSNRYLTDGFIFSTDKTKIYYDTNKNGVFDEGEDDLVASVENKKFILNKATSKDYDFYVKLTFTNQFVAYLHFYVEAYELPTTTDIFIGNYDQNAFVQTIELKDLVGENYANGYKTADGKDLFSELNIKDFTGYSYSDKKLTFINNATNETRTQTVTVTIKDVVPSLTKQFTVNIQPSVNEQFVSGNIGKNQENPIATTVNETFNVIGSMLKVNIDKTNNKIEVQSNEATPTPYYTINAGNIASVDFDLYDVDDSTLATKLNNYFMVDNKVNAEKNTINLSTSRTLDFVHMAKDQVFKLVITVKTSSGSYSPYTIYIKLSETYTITANYRVEDAMFESVLSNTSFGISDANLDATNKTNYLFESYTGTSEIHASRFNIDLVRSTFNYSQFANLGFFEDGNPNKLTFEAGEGTDPGLIDPYTHNLIQFGSGQNADAVLNMSNSVGVNLNYNFKVQSEDWFYDKVNISNNVLVTGDTTKTISITTSQVTSSGLVLATLPYTCILSSGLVGPGITQPAYCTLTTGSVAILSIIDNQVVLTKVDNITAGSYIITITTLNGSTYTYTLVISNFEVEYTGYNEGMASEIIFAGNTYTIKDRVAVTNGDALTLTTDNLEYKGALNGAYNEYYGSDFDDAAESLIYWHKNSDLQFEIRAVNSSRTITLVFDVKDSGTVIGRICYVLQIQNHIEINLNGTDDVDKSVDVYLGSDAYQSANSFTIDLMSYGNSTNGYNNVFVNLVHKKGYDIDGNIIKTTIFNGSSGANVGEHLRFEVLNTTTDLVGRFSVDNGVITITTNKAGSFTLRITSVGAPGYSEDFTVNVHTYENVKAIHTKDNINNKNGSGWTSGEEIDVYTTSNSADASKYGFVLSKTQCNGVSVNDVANVDFNGVEPSFSYAILSDKNTTLSGISWKTASLTNNKFILPQVPYGAEYYIVIRMTINKVAGNDYYAYYQVHNDIGLNVNDLYSANGKNRVLTFDEDAWSSSSGNEQLIFMDYDNKGLYSAVNVVNSSPEDDWADKYYNLTYQKLESLVEGSFVKGTHYIYNGSGFVLATSYNSAATYYTKHYTLIKGTDGKYYEPISTGETYNSGMTYYVYNGSGYEATTISSASDFKVGLHFKQSATAPTFKAGVYYKTNNIQSKLGSDLKFRIYKITTDGKADTSNYIQIVADTDGTFTYSSVTITGTFVINNSERVIVALVDDKKDGVAANDEILFSDTWTFKSANQITTKSERPLTDFFLGSELSNDLLGKNVVGVTNSWSNNNVDFVNNATKSSGVQIGYWTQDTDGKYMYNAGSGSGVYSLYKVTYSNSSGVFHSDSKDYYVLVGKSSSMQVVFNAGEYINIVVDDTLIERGGTIDLSQYVMMWSMSNGGEFASSSATLSLTDLDTNDKITVSGQNITITDIDQLSSNIRLRAFIKITANGITRRVPVDFTFIISAKSEYYDTTNGAFKYNESIINALGDETSKTYSRIDTSAEKLALLDLIKYDGGLVTSSDYSNFEVVVTKGTGTDNHTITYTYNNGSTTYSRTFKMLASAS